MKKKLFQETSLAGIQMRNRFIRSATMELMADNKGNMTDELSDRLLELADGGVGLIITGTVYISPKIESTNKGIWFHHGSSLDKLSRLVKKIHKKGAKIGLQMSYIPSETKAPSLEIQPSSISKEEISTIPKYFAEHIQLAKNLEFDCVQIHSAHGNLLSRFLSPLFNSRNDKYNGSLENRSRLILEILRETRKLLEDFPVIIKMHCSEKETEGGFSIDDSKQLCIRLAESGISGIEISGGNPVRTNILKFEYQGYFGKESMTIADSLDKYSSEKNIPPVSIISVGGHRNIDLMEQLLNSAENINFISLSRTLICEPDLISNWKIDRNYIPKCKACNKCLESLIKGKKLNCAINNI